jgi:hypothetical protein
VKGNSIFWISYSDLLTSLFFVMLVLFVVSVGYLKYEQGATKKVLDKIKALDTAVTKLPKGYFRYDSRFRRHELAHPVSQFDKGSALINPAVVDSLVDVGKSINKLIKDLHQNREYKEFDIKYLLIIEGMASQDNYPENFQLSYLRSKALYDLWKDNLEDEIIFDPNFCEIQIAGSGTDGIRAYHGKEEAKNQRFQIQIVPKIGRLTEP